MPLKYSVSRKFHGFKLVLYIYLSTRDINTTVSTWHERITSTSNPPLGMRKLIDRHFAISSVYGNISMMII